MKTLCSFAFILAFLVILFLNGISTLAQQPIPVASPYYLRVETSIPLYTIHNAPTPVPTTTPYIAPYLPTATPFGWFHIRLQTNAFVYTCPSVRCAWQYSIRANTIVWVRWAGIDWLQMESGQYWGWYLQDTGLYERLP